nr:hypothetical protein Iba_chr07cCG10760 [Ipomoea batatas]
MTPIETMPIHSRVQRLKVEVTGSIYLNTEVVEQAVNGPILAEKSDVFIRLHQVAHQPRIICVVFGVYLAALLLQGDHVSEEEFSGVIDFDTRDDFKRELILEQEHVFASFLPFNAIARITIAAFLAFQNKLNHKATVKHQHFYQLFIVLGIDVFECPTSLLRKDFEYLFLYSLSLT